MVFDGNLLDLVLTNEIDLIKELKVHSELETPLSTDHLMISFDLQEDCNQSYCLKSTGVFDYSKADWEGLNNYLLDCKLADLRHKKNCLRTLTNKAEKHPPEHNLAKLANAKSSFTSELRQLRTTTRKI